MTTGVGNPPPYAERLPPMGGDMSGRVEGSIKPAGGRLDVLTGGYIADCCGYCCCNGRCCCVGG